MQDVPGSLIYLKQRTPSAPDHRTVPDPDKQTESKEAKPSRLDEARRIIEEYAAEPREIIQKLRRKMN